MVEMYLNENTTNPENEISAAVPMPVAPEGESPAAKEAEPTVDSVAVQGQPIHSEIVNTDGSNAPAPVPAAAPIVKTEGAPKPKGPKKVKKAPERVEIPPPEMPRPAGLGRPLAPEELQMERDRIYARLTSIPNVTSRPSPSDYVVFEVNDPTNVHKKLVALGVPMDVVQKYPKLPNGLRVFVRTAKMNEEFLRALEQAVR